MPQPKTEAAAHQQYNATFNNDCYQTLRQIVVNEVASKHAPHQSLVLAYMNLIIDSCMYGCGHPGYTIGVVTRLAAQLKIYGHQALGQSIADYLHHFDPETAELFLTSLKTFTATCNAYTQLLDIYPETAALPGWQGNTIYRLLAAASDLLNTTLILMDSDHRTHVYEVPYAGEQFQHAIQALTMVQEEMRNAHSHERFDSYTILKTEVALEEEVDKELNT